MNNKTLPIWASILIVFVVAVVVVSIVSYVIYRKITPAPTPSIITPSSPIAHETMEVKVYFVDKRMINARVGYEDMVRPVMRTIPKTEDVVRAIIEELLKGLTSEEEAQGYITLIPYAKQISSFAPHASKMQKPYSYGRVKLLSLNIEDKIAYVDFSNELEAYGGGSTASSLIYWQIVKTLTPFPAIGEVVISVEGRTEDVLQP